MKKVLLIGGGGYVGTELQKLLALKGYSVRVFDTFWYQKGRWPENSFPQQENIEYIQGDVRNLDKLKLALKDIDYCIHLACISNDPSYELNPNLAKEVNFDAFKGLIPIINESGLSRFIYASSSSVYGVKKEPNVTEELELEPISDYSKFKAACENLVSTEIRSDLVKTIVRPSTICGYSYRQRFDLVVNILTKSAIVNGEINVDGGDQFRPNLHIQDMIECYSLLLESDETLIDNEIFNVAGENLTVNEIASKVKAAIGDMVKINYLPVKDPRSYRVSGDKISNSLGFKPKLSVDNAIFDLNDAFKLNRFENPEWSQYYNIRRMKEILHEAT